MTRRWGTITGILAVATLALWSVRCKDSNNVVGVVDKPTGLDLRGTWTGTFTGAGGSCAKGVPASATVSQDGASVGATLEPGASCDQKALLQAQLTGSTLSGTVFFNNGPAEYAEHYKGAATGSVSGNTMTLQVGRVCDTAEDGGCYTGGTLTLNKKS
jgi:hypothetical protein